MQRYHLIDPLRSGEFITSRFRTHITDLMASFAEVAGYQVPRDRKVDGVNQWPLLTGKTKRSARQGFPVYNGYEMFAYKWRNFKIHFIQQDSMFDTPVRHNFPRIHNLIRDPKEMYGISGGVGETGAENLTWVLPAITKEVVAFQKSLSEEPPIILGTPEPYVPSR